MKEMDFILARETIQKCFMADVHLKGRHLKAISKIIHQGTPIGVNLTFDQSDGMARKILVAIFGDTLREPVISAPPPPPANVMKYIWP